VTAHRRILLRVLGRVVAVGLAAVVLGACGSSSGADAPAAAPLPDDLLPLLKGQVDCGGQKLLLVRQHFFDFTGDGVPDAIVAVRCDEGMGSPPSAVFAIAAGTAGPRVAGELLKPTAGEVVSDLDGAGSQAIVTTFAFGPTAPRCCPDLQVVHRYEWNGTAFDAGTGVATPLPSAGPDDG
jgi:hypothetical protein